MRVRQASIAVSSCSGASSASDATGSGVLTITSCAPSAGRAAKSSGSPRPRASGSAPAASAPAPAPASPPRAVARSEGSSAGYRFGTARTRQPGPSGAPPSARSAHTSGGVRSSCPPRNGSDSGSSGGAGSTENMPPGRSARSPATIVRNPDSGSMRSSGIPAGSARVALDVGGELALAGVHALLHGREPPAAVVERRRGEGDRALEEARDLALAVPVARVGHGDLAQEAPRRARGVVGVRAEERDPPPAGERLAAEERNFGPARPAPRRPLVDHHRVPPQLAQARPERAHPAAEDPPALGVETGKPRRRLALEAPLGGG